MIPLIVLVGMWALMRAAAKLLPFVNISPGTSGRVPLALMLCMTGFAHFIIPEQIALLVPPLAVEKSFIVYLTGGLEVMCALGILIPQLRKTSGVILIFLLLAFIPANVYGALNHVELGGHRLGPIYLLFRIPLQLFFVWWAWHFAARGEAA